MLRTAPRDEVREYFTRRAADAFAPGPAVIAGTEAIIRVAALQLELPLAEIYAGVPTG